MDRSEDAQRSRKQLKTPLTSAILAFNAFIPLIYGPYFEHTEAQFKEHFYSSCSQFCDGEAVNNLYILSKMLHKVTSLRDFKRKVSPPQPTFMTDEQKCQYLHTILSCIDETNPLPPVDYLSSLRSDRPARPSGSRPPPFKTSTYPSPPQL